MPEIIPDTFDSKARAAFRLLCENCTKSKCGNFVSPLPYSTLRQVYAAFLLSKIQWADVPEEIDAPPDDSVSCRNFLRSERMSSDERAQKRASAFRRKLEERQLRLF
jgi:hypothetical protein